jgi:tRNA-binding protein
MKIIDWKDFERVELRVGTIQRIEDFPEARKPAYQAWVDLGDFGIKKSSAQITDFYSKEDLIGKQVICVTNFTPKQIGPIISEVLITGFVTDSGVVIAQPERTVPNGTKLA